MKRYLLTAGLALGLAIASFGAFAANALQPSADLYTASMATGITSLALASAVLATPSLEAALRTPVIGDKVEFIASANDFVLTPGSRYPAEITHIWSPSCVNVEIEQEINGERTTLGKTSVFLRQGDTTPPAGYYAEFAAPA